MAPSLRTYSGVLEKEEVDPRPEPEDEAEEGPIENLEDVRLCDHEQRKVVKIETRLDWSIREQLVEFLRMNKDVFSWSHADICGISSEIICHALNIKPGAIPVRQKRRAMDPEKYKALKEEVRKLLDNGFIKETHYTSWVANPVLVKNTNGKWRTCIDFYNLNDASPKDSFPLPRIDQLVDTISGYELLSFMDAYSGYNQIAMHFPDQENTSFMTDQGLYCYKVMSFDLNNA